MLTLQKLLELLDVNSVNGANVNAFGGLGTTANSVSATKPTSEARREMATLRVPEKFHQHER